MSVYLFNERPGVTNVADYICFPCDGVEMHPDELDALKGAYPSFAHKIETGEITVYDSKKDKETIEARQKEFNYFMSLKPRQVPIIKIFPGEKMSLRDITIQGARAKKRFLEDYSNVDR